MATPTQKPPRDRAAATGAPTHGSQNIGNITTAAADVKIDEKGLKRKPSSDWLNSVYQQAIMSDDDLLFIYDTIKYKGFDRDEMLAQMEEKIGSPKLTAEVIMVCSLRGPRQAAKVVLSNGKTLSSMGIPASDQKGTQNISCQRISSATADLAALFFKRLGVPKRILNSPLPGWLQFPTAGSIKMPEALRAQHIEFARKFSEIIGGTFNEQIYATMMANSYLDERLNLFAA